VPPSDTFDREILPHLDGAYNLARWLAGNPADAEDVVQDACVRALRYSSSMRGGHGKAWFLTIMRNAYYDWVARNRPVGVVVDVDELAEHFADPCAEDPEDAAIRADDSRALADALAAIPLQFREVIVLRAVEELSYKQIASIVGVPIGTVMSRLARARAMLRRAPRLRREDQPAKERRRT